MIFRKTSDDEEGGAAIYGMAQTFSDRSMVDLMARAYLVPKKSYYARESAALADRKLDF